MRLIHSLFLFILSSVSVICQQDNLPSDSEQAKPTEPKCPSTAEILESFRLRNGESGMMSMNNKTLYSKYRLPAPKHNRIGQQVWLQGVSDISELNSDFTLDMYMNEVWHDPRLNYEDLTDCHTNISLDHEVYDKIWTPNTCFINGKDAKILVAPFRSIFLMIYTNGTVWVNYRVHLIGPCQMHLRDFPLDTQVCEIIFESFNYNNEVVTMYWMDPPIPKYDIVQSQFDMLDVYTFVDKVLYPAGFWDEMHVKFKFKRRYGWYIWQCYIPTYLTVFISWISFFLGTRSIPARTMLGVNALLALNFQFGSILKNLPRVSYVKAIDVWMLGGMFFIFASLIELALIGYLTRNNDHRRQTTPATGNQLRKQSSGHQNKFCHMNSMLEVDRDNFTTNSMYIFPRSTSLTSSTPAAKYRTPSRTVSKANVTPERSVLCCCLASERHKLPERIDVVSMYMFPVMFLLFNVVYWGRFLHFTDT